MKQERPDEAILDYESCLRYSPDDRRILLLLASAQLNNGNPSAALEAVNCYFGLPDPDCHPQSDHRRRPAVCPDNSRAGRPYLECRFGRPEKGKAGAWAIKGMALLSLGRNSEALVCFASALMDDPLDTEVMRVMGGIFYSCSRYDEALQLCDRELALDPDNAVALLNRAITLGALGRHMEAAATCRKALDKIPDAVEGWKYLGALCTHLGRHDEACDAYRQALMVSPDDEDVKTNLAGAEKRSKEEE
jgi:tetratricopeptide (TPR) repeat protein